MKVTSKKSFNSSVCHLARKTHINTFIKAKLYILATRTVGIRSVSIPTMMLATTTGRGGGDLVKVAGVAAAAISSKVGVDLVKMSEGGGRDLVNTSGGQGSSVRVAAISSKVSGGDLFKMSEGIGGDLGDDELIRAGHHGDGGGDGVMKEKERKRESLLHLLLHLLL